MSANRKPGTALDVAPNLGDLSGLAPDVQDLVLKLAAQMARQSTISELWQVEEATSYWVLLVAGAHRTEQLQIARELLTWSAFSARGASHVVCIQSSDRKEFKLCTNHFGALEYPCLFLGTAPSMNTFVGVPRAVLQAICSKEGGLNDFLTESHMALVRGESLEQISNRLLKDKAKRYAEILYKEIRSIVSFKGSVDAKAEWKV